MKVKNIKKDKIEIEQEPATEIMVQNSSLKDFISLSDFMKNYFMKIYDHFNQANVEKIKYGEEYFYMNEDIKFN